MVSMIITCRHLYARRAPKQPSLSKESLSSQFTLFCHEACSKKALADS